MFLRLFHIKGGWAGQCSHTAWRFLKWGVSNFPAVEHFVAMDLMLQAESFRLGVKRSSITLPWENPSMSAIFGKKPRLISAPKFFPMPNQRSEDETLAAAELSGRVTWSRVTSVIPWPVAQEKSLGRVLENWRIILVDNPEASDLGRQIRSIVDGENLDVTVEQVIRDALGRRAVSTLRSRSSSLMAFARWKKSLSEDATIFPISEEEAYRYVVELRQLNAPRTRASRFLESLNFAHYMIGADVGASLRSSRLKGAVAVPMVVPKKKTPLTAKQISAMETLAIHGEGQEAIFAGYVCMVLHARLRWSDGQYCQLEPWLDLHEGVGFLECELYHHKNAGRQRVAKRLLPAACCIPGLVGDWASRWLDNRRNAKLVAGPGFPTMPVPLTGGGWGLVPLEPPQATVWLRELLSKVDDRVPLASVGTHSLKASMLSWMAKCNCPESLRRLAGYHVDPGSKSALEYSRDGQAPVLHALEGILLIVRSGLFDPDQSRAKRWKRPECKTLHDAISFLSLQSSRTEEVESLAVECDLSDQLDEFEAGSSDYDLSISSMSDSDDERRDEAECNTSGEDREAEVSAPIVGALVAQGLHYELGDVKVFEHVKSGCCHIAKDSEVDSDDGEATVLRCGKIVTRNFRKVHEVGNFMPYKCTRCFSAHRP